MTATNENELSEKIAIALQHLSEGGTLKDLAQFTPEELEAVNAVASSYFSAHKYGEAADLYRYLCMYDHLESRWHYSLGVCLQADKKYKEAVSSYVTAMLLKQDDPRPQAQTGYCLLAMGELEGAEGALQECLATSGDNPEYADIKKQAAELLESVKKQLAAKK